MYLALQNIALGAFPQNDQIPVRKVIGYARERANQQIKPLMPMQPSHRQQPMTPGSFGWRQHWLFPLQRPAYGIWNDRYARARHIVLQPQIGRASCRESVGQYV